MLFLSLSSQLGQGPAETPRPDGRRPRVFPPRDVAYSTTRRPVRTRVQLRSPLRLPHVKLKRNLLKTINFSLLRHTVRIL